MTKKVFINVSRRENMLNKNFDVFRAKKMICASRTIMNFLVLSAIFVGFWYLVFWLGVISDEAAMHSARAVFDPIAHFFYPNIDDLIIYRNTGFCLFCSIIPWVVFNCILDRFEQVVLNIQRLIEEDEMRKLNELTMKEQMVQYDVIKNYSICLSLDYDSNTGVSAQNRQFLNKMVFDKISNAFKNQTKYLGSTKISTSDVLIVTSSDFSKYDLIYDTMQSLAKIKKDLEAKNNLKLIPSITTDAFCNDDIKLNEVRKSHFEIQSFNFKNRSMSSAMFAKKYRHLNQKKYIGIPIGEYAYFKNNKTDTYELNVVQKNLTVALSKM